MVGDLTWSSPRTRGYFAVEAGDAAAHRVVPAHAGVFPRGATVTGAPGSRPRARGGISPETLDRYRYRASSPRTRGYFRDADRSRLVQPVVPAHAGVFLIARPNLALRVGRPRARGGISTCAVLRWSVPASSPRTRGYFWTLGTWITSILVVPAHAGVFLGRGRGGRRPRGRPRARGGISWLGECRSPRWPSSPRTRG